MKKRIILPVVIACLLLTGCSWMDGSYLSITPHQEQSAGTPSKDRSVGNYLQLRAVMEEMVDSGIESAVIDVTRYQQNMIEGDLQQAAMYVAELYPLGAWSVDEITYEVGTGGGRPAVSVNISYIHGRSEIRKIRETDGMAKAQKMIVDALAECSDSVVVLVKNFEAIDFVQIVEDYAKNNPDVVMELPQVAVGVYPDTGTSRILEVKFTYETSRESLRQMQQQVRRVFESASLYVSADAAEGQKFAQLYTFLMERFDYEVQTSITPAYSLLNHGVGDGKTFATVYAAMCRRAGLDCQLISGTKNGQSWHWNLICEDGVNYHIDLLQCSQTGQFQRLIDAQMEGYVWDYSAYGGEPMVPAEIIPAETEKNGE